MWTQTLNTSFMNIVCVTEFFIRVFQVVLVFHFVARNGKRRRGHLSDDICLFQKPMSSKRQQQQQQQQLLTKTLLWHICAISHPSKTHTHTCTVWKKCLQSSLKNVNVFTKYPSKSTWLSASPFFSHHFAFLAHSLCAVLSRKTATFDKLPFFSLALRSLRKYILTSQMCTFHHWFP